MLIQTVALRDVKFFAKHGYYEQEQLTGNEFHVSITVSFLPAEDSESLQHTVNYETLNLIMREEMEETQKLLETVVKNMLNSVLKAFPFLLTAQVSIKKLHPAMPGDIDHSFVQLHYTAPSRDGAYYTSF